MRVLPWAVVIVTLAHWPTGPLAAQSDLGLPAFQQSNLLASGRSPLYFQPYVPAHPGTRVAVSFDYANIYELSYGWTGGEQVQDLELSTFRFTATRDLSRRSFVAVDLPVTTAWKGTLDGFLGWWHGLLGIEIPQRALRPENRFGYRVLLPNGDSVHYRPGSSLGDLRLGGGLRLGQRGQLLATLTLPTATAEGYGRGVVTGGAILSTWTDLDPRLRVEGNVGLGLAPHHDDALRPYQKTAFGSVGGGFRWRFYKQASMFGTLWWHSPYYARTGMASLDRADLTFDFGWIIRTRGGDEWRFGMAEDPAPTGPGVDAIFKASRSW